MKKTRNQVEVQGLERTERQLSAAPGQIARARTRALSKLRTYAGREVARVVAAAVGTTRSRIIALARLGSERKPGGALELWIGTNPIAAQYLGVVRWRRQWPGAKAGNRQFPHTWSWIDLPGAKTGQAIMQQNGGRFARSRRSVSEFKLPIHDHVLAALPDLEARILARFETLLRQELNYALRVETRAA